MKISKLTFYYTWFGKTVILFFLLLNSIFNYKKIKLKFIYGWKNTGFYNKYINIDARFMVFLEVFFLKLLEKPYIAIPKLTVIILFLIPDKYPFINDCGLFANIIYI